MDQLLQEDDASLLSDRNKSRSVFKLVKDNKLVNSGLNSARGRTLTSGVASPAHSPGIKRRELPASGLSVPIYQSST